MRSFTKIAKSMIELKPAELYFYAKVKMLAYNKAYVSYNQKTMGTNPITKERELSKESIQSITNSLVDKGYLYPAKDKVGGQFESYLYKETKKGETDYWVGIYNDFINLGISAKAKGFAIKLAMLKNIPDNYKAMSKETGVGDKACKKYCEELIAANVLIGNKLSSVYFYEVTAEQKRFEEELAKLSQIEETNPEYKKYQKQLDWVKNHMMDFDDVKHMYNFGTKMLKQIQAGTFKKMKMEKQLESIIL